MEVFQVIEAERRSPVTCRRCRRATTGSAVPAPRPATRRGTPDRGPGDGSVSGHHRRSATWLPHSPSTKSSRTRLRPHAARGGFAPRAPQRDRPRRLPVGTRHVQPTGMTSVPRYGASVTVPIPPDMVPLLERSAHLGGRRRSGRTDVVCGAARSRRCAHVGSRARPRTQGGREVRRWPRRLRARYTPIRHTRDRREGDRAARALTCEGVGAAAREPLVTDGEIEEDKTSGLC